MLSKFPKTKCPFCPFPIFKGDAIAARKTPDGKSKFGHVLCPTKDVHNPEAVVKVFNRKRNWSDRQLAVFESVTKGKDNLVISAKPGSGKTTTIVESVFRYLEVYPKAKVLFIAFGVDIVKELSSIIGQIATVKTFHSFGKYVFTEAGYRVKVDDKEAKLEAIINGLLPLDEENETGGNKIIRAQRLILMAMIKAAKNSLIDYKDQAAVLAMADDYGIDLNGSADFLLPLLPLAMQECMDQYTVMDFSDMPWMPLVYNCPTPKFDLVLVDEAQDANPANLEMMRRMQKAGCRIIAVGDPDQSLFGFRGADSEAMEKLTAGLNAKVLPLSVTYRCPVKHVEYLQQYVPDIEAAPGAKLGVLEIIDQDEVMEKVKDKDLLVCRTNAPMVRFALKLIRHGRKAMVRGRDLVSTLITIIRKFEVEDIAEYFKEIQKYYDKQYTLLGRRNAKPAAFDKLDDTVEVLRAFGEDANSVDEVIQKIQKVFSDDLFGIVCSSIHKAKGLEFETVFVLEYDRPNFAGTEDNPKALKQEQNCRFVACSRSSDTMYLVRQPLKK